MLFWLLERGSLAPIDLYLAFAHHSFRKTHVIFLAYTVGENIIIYCYHQKRYNYGAIQSFFSLLLLVKLSLLILFASFCISSLLLIFSSFLDITYLEIMFMISLIKNPFIYIVREPEMLIDRSIKISVKIVTLKHMYLFISYWSIPARIYLAIYIFYFSLILFSITQN